MYELMEELSPLPHFSEMFLHSVKEYGMKTRGSSPFPH